MLPDTLLFWSDGKGYGVKAAYTGEGLGGSSLLQQFKKVQGNYEINWAHPDWYFELLPERRLRRNRLPSPAQQNTPLCPTWHMAPR